MDAITRRTVVRQVLLQHANQPFDYGALDCVQFVNHVIKAVTGHDHAENFPQYKTELEALAILDDQGGLDGLFTGLFGAGHDPAQLTIGDPCLVDLPIGPAMGIRVPDGAIVKTAGGSLRVSEKRIIKGWKI